MRPLLIGSVTRLGDAGPAERNGADMVEVRLDYFDEDPKDVIKRVRDETDLPIIATLRWKEEGGRFTGSEGERKRKIINLLPAVDYVDIELRAKSLKEVVEKTSELGKKTIVSIHHFDNCPDLAEMEKEITEAMGVGDIAKLAVEVSSGEELTRLANLAVRISSKKPEKEFCLLGMGEFGRLSRILLPGLGSSMVYCSVVESTAPGQLSLEEMRLVLDVIS